MGSVVTVRVDASGALVLPRETREALGIPEGGGELRLAVAGPEGWPDTGIDPGVVTRLRDLLRPWRRAAGSAVDALLLERQLEAALEGFDILEARRLRAAIEAARA